MKLNEIQLHNFGSYEGTNSISFSSDDASKRVTIIGGKNGAGKTTLFTAIQVCLYGHYAFGYKSASKRYLSEIFTLINNKARLSENGTCFIKTSHSTRSIRFLWDCCFCTLQITPTPLNVNPLMA